MHKKYARIGKSLVEIIKKENNQSKIWGRKIKIKSALNLSYPKIYVNIGP
jgi:hypothetical protein